MRIAAAQTKPTRYNIEANLIDHYQMIEAAAEKGVQLIVFPEMSITGYEHSAAQELAFTETDHRLDILRELAVHHQMIIIAGAPIQIGNKLYIGSFIMKPDNSLLIYTKQYLHPGEEKFFSSSFDYDPLITLGDERISLAICADIDHIEHAENASKRGTTVYIPSIFFSPKGIPEAHELLGNYSKKYSMNILMSNFCVYSWENEAGGRSAFWNKEGELIAELANNQSGLLIIETTYENEKVETTSEIQFNS